MLGYPIAYFLTRYLLSRSFSLTQSTKLFFAYAVIFLLVFGWRLTFELNLFQGLLFIILGFQGALLIVELMPEEQFDYGREDFLDRSYFLVAFLLLILSVVEAYFSVIALLLLSLLNGFLRNNSSVLAFRGGIVLTLLLHWIISFTL